MKDVFPKIEDSLLVVIDVQERLIPVIDKKEEVIKNIQILVEGAKVFGIDTVLTEQYPRGLGHTIEEIKSLAEDAPVYAKTSFSCMLNDDIGAYLKSKNKKHLIICGVESHICVLKTALDAIAQGYQVHVVTDGVSSRKPESKEVALQRLRQSGAYMVTTEMILFMLMDCAGTEEFKQISRLIK